MFRHATLDWNITEAVSFAFVFAGFWLPFLATTSWHLALFKTEASVLNCRQFHRRADAPSSECAHSHGSVRSGIIDCFCL